MPSRLSCKRGQGVVEMALFGSLLILAVGTIISYVQRLNDQQYIQMEAFRRAEYRGCTYTSTANGGAGGSASATVVQNRRHADLNGYFMKGTTQAASASSSVYWAVPKTSESSDNIKYFRVNDDEHDIVTVGTDDDDDDEEDTTNDVDDIKTTTDKTFYEANTKQEDRYKIVNTRSSNSSETIETKFVNEDGGTIWSIRQGMYRDTSGQYRFDDSKVGAVVQRGKQWETPF